jgi:hypothetical protein
MAFGGFLKQSTAVDVLIGPFVDDTDGKTSETALTLSQADIKLSKNGQALAQKSDVTAAAHDSDGYYNCELDATDTNTVGQLVLIVHESGALPVRHEYHVIEEAIYDALYGASAAGFDANQRVNVGSWLSTAVTLSSGAPDVNIQSTDDIDLSATQKASVNAECDTALTDYDAVIPADLNDPTAAAIADAVWDEAATGHTDAGKAGQQLWTDVDAILADTNELQTDDVPGLIGALNDPTSAAIADQVWDEAKAGHVGAGSFGEEVQAHALTSEVAAVETDTQDIQSRLPAALVTGRMSSDAVAISGSTAAADSVEANIGNLDAAISGLNDLSAAEVNAEVVDVVDTDTMTLPGQAAPPLAPTMRQALGWLYKVLRNRKTQTSTQWSLLADDESTVDAKATVSDSGGTATKQEIVSGP